MNIRDGKELLDVLVGYAMQAWDCEDAHAPFGDRARFEVAVRERMAQAAQAISLDAEVDRELVEAVRAIDEGPALVEVSMPEDMPAGAPVCGVASLGSRSIAVHGETFAEVLPKAARAAKRLAADHSIRRSVPPAFIPSAEPDEIEPSVGDVVTVEPRFRTSEDPTRLYSLDEMLAANDETVRICDWLRAARIGDRLVEMHGARVERVS